MKQHMLPETARMFAQCVHNVAPRKEASGSDIMRWLSDNIPKTDAGFRPWIRSNQGFKFMHERDAVAFALKWQ